MSFLILRSTATASSGGSAVDGEEYSFTSPSSNSNTASKHFMGGLGGILDAGTPDSNFSNASWELAGNYMPRWTTTQTLCRSRSLGFWNFNKGINLNNWSSFGMAIDLGSGFSEVFLSAYVYFGCNTSENLTQLQWKLFRLMPTVSVVDTSPQAYTTNWLLDGGDSWIVAADRTTFLGDPGDPEFALSPNKYPAFNTGEWYHLKHWIRPATSESAADGTWTAIWTRVSDGATVVDNSGPADVDDYDSATRYRYFVLQNYFGNSAPNNESDPDEVNDFSTPGDGFAYWDDIALQWGTGAQKAIWLGDASTSAACTDFVYQEWSTWSGTDRTITMNKGPFTDLTGKYLYETDASGAFVDTDGIAL